MLQRIKKDRSRLYGGWAAVIAGSFIVFIAGNFQYTFGVFVSPLINNFGWSRAAISGCVTIRSITSGLASLAAGILCDRYGYRKLIFAGVLLVGASYLLTAHIGSLWQLYIYLGALTGIGISAFFVPLIGVVTRWFGSKATLGSAIVMSGFSLAQVVIPPIATLLIVRYQWEGTITILGIAVLLLGTAALHFVRTPSNGSRPLSPVPESGEGLAAEPAENIQPPVEADYSLREALRTPALWIIFAVLMISATSYQMLVIHIVIAAIDEGITPEAAAIILTVSGVTNTLGRLLIGSIASAIGNKTALILSLVLQAAALFAVAGASDLAVFYIVVAVHGLGYGGTTPILPTLTASYFGTRSIGSIYGVVNVAYTAGGAVGPVVGGYIFDLTGSYYAAFIAAGVIMLVTLLIVLALKAPRRK
jgi:MFS family permease